MRRRAGIAIAVAAMTLLLGGCSQGGSVNEDLTVQDAKAIAQQMEDDIAALVPEEYVTEVVQNETGHLMQCDEDGAYQWTGLTRVYISDDIDVEAVVASVAEEFSAKEGFSVREETTSEGDPRAHIIGEYGAGYLFSPREERTYLAVSSFSPCFRLPPDVSPRDEF